MLKINKKKIKAYGDRLDDGAIQLAFTLPIAASPEAREAARHYVEKLGLKQVAIATMEPMGESFCSFVAYGNTSHTIDLTKIKIPKLDHGSMDYDALKAYMARHLEKPIVVVGATTGSDAHTVGLDAIMNMKGYAHDWGLERYPLFEAHNLRSQLGNRDLIEKAKELGADAVLISQIVTQRDAHIKNLKEFMQLARKQQGLSKDVLLIVGGPRLDHAHAVKLGFDAGFGPGTKPSWVANFIVREYMKRKGIAEKVESVEKAAPKAPSKKQPSAPEDKDAVKPAVKHKKSARRGKRGGRGRRTRNAHTAKKPAPASNSNS